MTKLTLYITALALLTLGACSTDNKSKSGKEVDHIERVDVPADNFTGVYIDSYDGSKLEIGKDTNSGLNVTIDIVRLTLIDDGIGRVSGDTLSFAATDANGEPIKGKITFDGDSATLVFTESTWGYLPNGTTFSFTRSANDDN